MDSLEIIKKVKAILELDKNTIVGFVSGFILGVIPVLFVLRHYWRLDLFQRCKQYKSERDGLLQDLLTEADKLEREQAKNKKLQEEIRDLQQRVNQLEQQLHLQKTQRSDSPDTGKTLALKTTETTSLPLVTNRQEIEENVKLFDGYLSGNSTEREFARNSLVRGKCFVVLRENGRSYFAPSKFVGYSNDNMSKYEAHVDYLDGRTTNNAINSVLQRDCTAVEEVNQEFRSYCERAGIPISIGNHRRFWRIER